MNYKYPATKLLRRPKPFQDETLLSYLLRLAEANHADNLHWIFSHIIGHYKPNLSQLHSNDTFFYQLAQLTDNEQGDLASLAYTPIGDDYVSFYQIKIPFKSLTINKPRLCPVCIDENRYYKKIWDMFFITSCRKHNIQLVGECEQCQTPIAWFRKKMCECRCGFDFRTSKRLYCEHKPIRLFDDYLENEIFGRQQENESLRQQYQDPIFKLSYIDIMRIISILSTALYQKHEYYLEKITRQMNLTSTRGLLNHSAASLVSWPGNFYRYLDWLSKRNENAEHDRRKEILYQFVEKSMKWIWDNAQFIAEAVKQYMLDTLDTFLLIPSWGKPRKALCSKRGKRWEESIARTLEDLKRNRLFDGIFDEV